MEKYIGLDVHAASTTFAVISQSGKRLGTYVVETNGQALVAQLKAIAGNKHICLEEGTQSAWLYEILSPWAARVVVVMVPQSRGQKSDEHDAYRLAEQLRTGAVKNWVFKEPILLSGPLLAIASACLSFRRWHPRRHRSASVSRRHHYRDQLRHADRAKPGASFES